MQDGELGDSSGEIWKGLEKKSSKLEKGRRGCSQRDSRCAKGSLHAQISRVKVKTIIKAETTFDAYAQDLGTRDLSKTEAAQVREVPAIEAENTTLCENSAVGNGEELASCAKPNANISSVQEHLTHIIERHNLNTFKYGIRWEETAHKLLAYGLPLEDVISVVKKCRHLPCTNRWVDSRLKTFTLLGMSHQEIGRLISRWPTILNLTDRSFHCKIEFFESIGVERHNLCKILPTMFMAFMISLSALRQKVSFWEDYMRGVCASAVGTMISNNPQILTYSVSKEKLEWLESQGFERKWLVKRSSILSFSLPVLISKAEVLEHFGISSARKRSRILVSAYSLCVPKLQARFDNLLTAGFSRDQARDIIMRTPVVLACTESLINSKINYAVQVMNVSLDALVSSPGLFSHNLETKIKYRYEVIKRLQTLGLLQHNVSPAYMVGMSKAEFNRKFVERFQDVVKQPDALSA